MLPSPIKVGVHLFRKQVLLQPVRLFKLLGDCLVTLCKASAYFLICSLVEQFWRRDSDDVSFDNNLILQPIFFWIEFRTHIFPSPCLPDEQGLFTVSSDWLLDRISSYCFMNLWFWAFRIWMHWVSKSEFQPGTYCFLSWRQKKTSLMPVESKTTLNWNVIFKFQTALYLYLLVELITESLNPGYLTPKL